jgi:hypothetical protein
MMDEIMQHGVMIIMEKSKCLKKTCPCASWFSTNPTWTTLVLAQDLLVGGW